MSANYLKRRRRNSGWVFDMQPTGSGVRNPEWTESETILALEAYVRLRPYYPRAEDDVILDLSDLLHNYAKQRGVTGATSFRNPYGVARKVARFRSLERGRSPSEVRGAQLEAEVWAKYGGDPRVLYQAANRLRCEIYQRNSSLPLEEPKEVNVSVSKGPPPAFGERHQVVTDGDCVVYVLQLSGPLAVLFPSINMDGLTVIKIGRSNNVDRRIRELNSGFPPGMVCQWQVAAIRPYCSARKAHNVEQRVIQRLAVAGQALGKEFAVAEISDFQDLLRDEGSCVLSYPEAAK